MAEYHRKIELQSPDDLQYLISNVRRAANEKIDKDLPPIEGEDKMRTRVEELVQDYVSKVFHITSQNLTINGLDPDSAILKSMLTSSTTTSSIEEHEPFDPRLWERAKELARQEEDLIEEIAALRRNMPAVAVEGVRGAYKSGLEDDERILGVVEERVRSEKAELGVEGLERGEDVEQSWMNGVRGLEGLKASLPEVVAKAERAKKAEEYVLSTQGK